VPRPSGPERHDRYITVDEGSFRMASCIKSVFTRLPQSPLLRPVAARQHDRLHTGVDDAGIRSAIINALLGFLQPDSKMEEDRAAGSFCVLGRDWHTLIEFCGLVGTILIDEDGG
jgi:hypothetical protein